LKSVLTKYLAGSAICLLAISALNGPVAAESIENQCRAAVRAELKGPNCRMANPRSNSLQVDPCGIPTTGSQMTLYTDKVVQCVAHGGPGRTAR
jgi:hypothetical protein